MNLLTTIFGSKKVIEEIIKMVDEMFTDENTKKALTKIKLLEVYHPFKITQRFIAIGFTFFYITLIFMLITLYAIGTITDNKLQHILHILNDVGINYVMLAIVGFYFAGGMFNSLKK